MSIPCEESIVVNVPAPADAPPIVTPSIVPPLMSTVVTVPKSANVPVTVGVFDNTIELPVIVTESPVASPKTTLPDALIVVNDPAAAVDPPITTLSAVPPLISAVVKTADAIVCTPVEFAIVELAVPSAALIVPVLNSDALATPTCNPA